MYHQEKGYPFRLSSGDLSQIAIQEGQADTNDDDVSETHDCHSHSSTFADVSNGIDVLEPTQFFFLCLSAPRHIPHLPDDRQAQKSRKYPYKNILGMVVEIFSQRFVRRRSQL